MANTTGHSNVAVGQSALMNNTTASLNIAIGRFALETNTTGELCCYWLSGFSQIIQLALIMQPWVDIDLYLLIQPVIIIRLLEIEVVYSNSTASDNSAVGYNALYSNTTGQQNIAVGGNALSRIIQLLVTTLLLVIML